MVVRSRILVPDAMLVTEEGVRCLLPVARGKLEFNVLLGRLEEMKAADVVVLPSDGNFEIGYGKGYDSFVKKTGKGTHEEARAYAKRFGPGEKGAGVPLGTAVPTSPGDLKHLKSVIYANYMKPAGDVRCDEEAVEICVKNELRVANEIGGKAMYVAAPDKRVLGMTLDAFLKGTWNGTDGYFVEAPEKPGIMQVSVVVNTMPSQEGANMVRGALVKALRSVDT